MNEETLFELALNTSAADLPGLLDRQCADDPVLRKRIEKLLAAHLASDQSLAPLPHGQGDSLDPFGSARPGSGPTTSAIGSMLGGKYKLIELIGDGGMGSVYMAQQTEPVRRLVAVKVIKSGMDSRAVLARFEAERQALAIMDHPNIAKVLDAGATESGSPYFVMELVKGVPITKFCDENQLTPRQRLELFLPVCEATEHSHQKGIIHRDIKPSNVLVAMYDDRAVPKVIDFGVAKATGHALADIDVVTGFGALVGTPEYMSPEQAGFNNLDIDTRTDVYSLGVLLYELLSGHTPVDRKSMEQAALLEILRIVRDVDAPLLSAKLSSIDTLPKVAANRRTEPKKLATQFRGELDWVLQKALEKDRSRRYATASSLARDIQRYLSNEIVEARPASTLYSLQKLFKRHRGQAVAAGLVLLSLLAGIVGTSWGLIHARQRQREAEAAQGQEAIQRGIAQANETKALLAKEEESRQRANAETEKQRAIELRTRALNALRATTGEDVEKLIGEKKVLSPNERAYLEAIAQRWQQFSAQEGNDQLSRAISAEGHLRVAHLWDQLGRREEALSEHEQAEKLFRQLAAEFPSIPDYTHSLATCCNNLGLVLDHLGRRVEARAKLSDGLALNQRLTSEFPSQAEYRLSLANNYHNLAIVDNELGNNAEALASYLQGLEIEEALVSDFPDQPEYRSGLAVSHSNLGALRISMGQYERAQEHYDRALAIREKLVADFTTQTEYCFMLANSYHNYGNFLESIGRSPEAVERLRQAASIKQELVADYPGLPEFANSLASTYNNLGSQLRGLGQLAESVSIYRQALAISENLVKTFPYEPEYQQDLATTYRGLANVLREGDKTELALELHQRALEIRDKLVRDFSTVPEYRKQLALSHYSLGQLLRELDKFEEAEVAYRTAQRIFAELVTEFPAVTAYVDSLAASHNSLGNLLADNQKLELALEQYRVAIVIRERLVREYPSIPEYRIDLAGVFANTAIKMFEADKPADSLEWFGKAIELLEPIEQSTVRSRKSTDYLQECYDGRSRAMDELQRYTEGERDWDRYVELNAAKDKLKLLTRRWKRLLRQGMIEQAIEHIAEFSKLPDENANLRYEYACIYALAADRSSSQKIEYADRAMELLNQAVQLGYDNAKRLHSDSDLAQLRDRNDFKQLVSEVESKELPDKPPSPAPE